MTDKEFTIKARNFTNIHLDMDDDKIHMGVWILHAHTAVTLTKDEAKQLIEALQQLTEEQTA